MDKVRKKRSLSVLRLSAIFWMGWRKSRKSSVKIAKLWALIGVQNLQNTNQESEPYTTMYGVTRPKFYFPFLCLHLFLLLFYVCICLRVFVCVCECVYVERTYLLVNICSLYTRYVKPRVILVVCLFCQFVTGRFHCVICYQTASRVS